MLVTAALTGCGDGRHAESHRPAPANNSGDPADPQAAARRPAVAKGAELAFEMVRNLRHKRVTIAARFSKRAAATAARRRPWPQRCSRPCRRSTTPTGPAPSISWSRWATARPTRSPRSSQRCPQHRLDRGARSCVLVGLTVALRRGTDASALLPAIEPLTTHGDPALASVAQQAHQRISGDIRDPRFGK